MQAVDSLMKKPFGKLRSDLIPCTKGIATLSLKFDLTLDQTDYCRYWTRVGTQVELCSADEDGVSLSCAYLNDEDQPGPVNIDVEPYDKPFRVRFSESTNSSLLLK